MTRCGKHERGGHKLRGRDTRKLRRIQQVFGDRHVSGRLSKGRKLRVGDLGGSPPESIHAYTVDGLRIERNARGLTEILGRRR